MHCQHSTHRLFCEHFEANLFVPPLKQLKIWFNCKPHACGICITLYDPHTEREREQTLASAHIKWGVFSSQQAFQHNGNIMASMRIEWWNLHTQWSCHLLFWWNWWNFFRITFVLMLLQTKCEHNTHILLLVCFFFVRQILSRTDKMWKKSVRYTIETHYSVLIHIRCVSVSSFFLSLLIRLTEETKYFHFFHVSIPFFNKKRNTNK